jgi:hypothetical protein
MRKSKAKAIAITQTNVQYEIILFATMTALAVLVFI